MMKKTSALFMILVFMLASLLWSQDEGIEESVVQEVSRTGNRGANFLRIGVGARAQALAGTYTAFAEDATALYWNPAGIAWMEQPAFSVTQTELFADINFQFVAVTFPFQDDKSFGLSATFLQSGDIPRTTAEPPNQTEEAFLGKTFDAASYAVGFTYSQKLTDRFSFGVTGKFIQERIFRETIEFVAFDVGTLFKTGLYGTSFAISLKNMGGSSRLEGPDLRVSPPVDPSQANEGTRDIQSQLVTTETSLPIDFHLGVRTDLVGPGGALLSEDPIHNIVLLFDVSDPIDDNVIASVASEYSLKNWVFGRIGFRLDQPLQSRTGNVEDTYTAWAIGGGVRIPFMDTRYLRVDYAFSSFGDILNELHTVSIEVGL